VSGGKVHALWVTDLLHQEQRWLTSDGRTIAIDAMTPDHADHALAWLRRHAAGLHASYETQLLLEPEPVSARERLNQHMAIAAHRRIAPDEWLDDTPLVRRLATLQARRRFLRHPNRFLLHPRRWWR
jgi:hypothetical protein